MDDQFRGAWTAINAYAKLLAQIAACRVAGSELDESEVKEAQAAWALVHQELVALRENRLTTSPNL